MPNLLPRHLHPYPPGAKRTRRGPEFRRGTTTPEIAPSVSGGYFKNSLAALLALSPIDLPPLVFLLVVSTSFHPFREDVMDNPAVFMEYAQSDSWIVVHLAQWFAALLVVGGLVALYYSITTKPEAGAGVARFGLATAVLTAASVTMLQAVDGVALKWAVDAWASAPADQEAAAFAAVEALRWTEYALQSFSNIYRGSPLFSMGWLSRWSPSTPAG